MALPDLSKASESFKKANPHIFADSAATLPHVIGEDPEPTKEEIKSEKELQEQITGFLERNNIVVIRSRTDRATTTKVGTPDLLFALCGRAVAFEVKLPGKKPTKEQEKMMERMKRNGWLVYVVDTYDDAREIANKLFLEFTIDAVK